MNALHEKEVANNKLTEFLEVEVKVSGRGERWDCDIGHNNNNGEHRSAEFVRVHS
jgi:hypothetical protein